MDLGVSTRAFGLYKIRKWRDLVKFLTSPLRGVQRMAGAFTAKTAEIATPLAVVRHNPGWLIGRMESLGFKLREEADQRILTRMGRVPPDRTRPCSRWRWSRRC